MSETLSVSQAARRLSEELGRDIRPRDISLLFYHRELRDDLAPIVNHCLDAFGPERVMFGGDWPVVRRAATYRQWVEALRSIVRNRSREQQQRLMHDNALRFYGLG